MTVKDILDSPIESSGEQSYLKKSAKICRVYLVLLIVCFMLSSLAKISDQFSDVLVILLGLALFVLFGLSPWGVYYTWKSKKADEGNRKKRLTYAIVHWFVFVLLVLVIIRFLMDVSTILKR